MKLIGHRAALLAAICLAAGCSTISDPFRDTGSRIDYKRAKSQESLEVPPDLTAPTAQGDLVVPELGEALASEYSDQASRRSNAEVLPELENIRIQRDNEQRWISIDAPVDTLWPRVRDFWSQLGFELKLDEPKIGIMETNWAENRADIPEDFIRGIISKVLPNAYSASTRDKYRVRLERVEGNHTEIYISHYGMEQVTAGETDVRWQPRPSDPELVNEMLNRMVLFLGAKEDQAQAMQQQADKKAESRRAQLQSGGQELMVKEGFARSWRRVGLALDKLGFIVEDRNRAAGIYYVRHAKQLSDSTQSKGWFSSLFSSSSDETGTLDKRYQVHLVTEGEEATRVTVQGGEGEAVPAEEVKALLERLHSELL